MNNIEIKKQREELEQYFSSLYNEDNSIIESKANNYSNGDSKLAQAFLDGYNEAKLSPHTLTIRYIVMYTLDYIPYYRKVPTIRNIVTSIRDILKNKLYKRGENTNNS